MAGEEDKREGERINILGELHGEVMVYQPTAIREISRRGAQIETSVPLQLNSLHEFRFTLGESSVVMKGRVVHCSITDVDQDVVIYRSGVEFIDAPDRVSSVIADFIDAVVSGRRAP